MKIKAVVFDLDGTLYPYYKMYLHSIPLFIKHSNFMYNFSRVRSAIRHVPEITDFRKMQAVLLAKRMDLPETTAYEMIERIIYGEWEGVFKRITPYPSLFSLIKKLKKLNLKLAVLSDYPVKNKLAYLGMGDCWDFALSSEETGYLKPHPKPFTEIAAKLNIPRQEVLYVGDIYAYDIIGAHNAGMKAAHFTPYSFSGQMRNEQSADIRFSGYNAFYRALVDKFCFNKSFAI